MTVNSGSLGTTISFSDLQTFYGGTHPISLSEYYRGGSEVPSTQTITVTETGSGTGSGSEDSITVTVANADTQSVGGLSIQTNQPGQSIQNTANLSFVELAGGGMGNHIVTGYSGTNASGGATSILQQQQDDLPDFIARYRGPAFQSGDVPGNPTNVSQYASISYSGFRQNGTQTRIGRRTISNVSRRTFTFTNNTGSTINMTATGNGTSASNSSLANGSSITISNVSGSGEGWSFTYTIQSTENTNTNIPTSGESNLDQFNVPGNAAG